MLTKDNTEGFTQEELEKMNAEVQKEMMNYDPKYNDYEDYLQWAEEIVLKKHGGA
jgi:hypothetical protein